MSRQKQTPNEAVQITVPAMVGLNKYASLIPLSPGQILARQSGNYQSPFKGRGMEFNESRLYQPGDDIRNIDWRVTARTGKTHTKLFREERERPVFLWVDLRASMFFATRGKFKSVVASNIASLLAWSAAHHGDRLGGVIFSESIHHELKPHRGKTGVLRFINKLVEHPAWQNPYTGQTDKSAMGRELVRLRRLVRPGSMIFLMSDFRHLNEAAEKQIIRLSKHNDVILVYIRDRLEEALPPAGRYRLSDGSKELAIDTFDKNYAEQYRSRYFQHVDHLVRMSRMSNIYLISCATNDDPLQVLQAKMTLNSKK
jgi:uncharacterized protein (DUF58 family)